MTDRELLLKRLERLAIVLDELMPRCAELVRDAIALLKEQEAVKPEDDYICGNIVNICGKCKSNLIARVKFCPWCGKEVKWDA